MKNNRSDLLSPLSIGASEPAGPRFGYFLFVRDSVGNEYPLRDAASGRNVHGFAFAGVVRHFNFNGTFIGRAVIITVDDAH